MSQAAENVSEVASAPSCVRRATAVMNTVPNQNHPVRNYRSGFSTSICQFFEDPLRRNDCCALACFGVLSSDRTKHLMHHLQQQEGQEQISSSNAPLSLKRQWATRLGFNVGIPVLLVVIYNNIMNNVVDENTRKTVSVLYFFLVIVFIIFLSLRGFKSRVNTRKDLIRIVEDRTLRVEGRNDSTNNLALYPTDEVHAHGCCGSISCYSADTITFSTDPTQQEFLNRSDICTKIWNMAKACCCGWCANWLQCCGMCAIGQEEREINRMVPRAQRMIDYISFQPYVEYYSSIQQLRQDANRNLIAHYKALSELSKLLMKVLISFLGICLLYSLLDINHNFTFRNLLVLLATFGQAFSILYFVHWHWNRFDLSLDAVIKYFGCGFLISVSFALVYEMVLQIVLAIVSYIVLILELTADGTAQKFADNPNSDQNKVIRESLKSHPELILAYAFFNAFVVAAFVEELSKYFGFWMVEHPDFLPSQELEEQNNYIKSLRQEEGQTNSANSASTDLFSHKRSSNEIGAGITIAMVAVATGFACCENLVYVFINSSTNFTSEILTLVVRSIFPVHPLCAAIQSIGVCRRDLEKDESMKLGKVIFPALLLHGTFDFVLMAVSAFNNVNYNGEDDKEKKDTTDLNELVSELPVFGICLLVLIFFIFYYVIASRRQKVRLDQIDVNQDASRVERNILLT